MTSTSIRIVGSAHSGVRGRYGSRLFVAKRQAGANWKGHWDVSTVAVEGVAEDIRIMGLEMGPSGLLAVASSKEQAFLATFDQRLEQTGWHEITGTRDPHALMVEGEHLWVVSTGTNEVIRYRLTETGLAEAESVFRHPADDPQHFNDIVRHGDLVILTAFGVSAAASRSALTTGYLIETTQRRLIKSGLDHPHSPFSYKGTLFFCESRPARIWKADQSLAELSGFARGLVIASDGYIHVGCGCPRPLEPDEAVARPEAELWSMSTDGNVLSRQKLVGTGPEIHDLIELP